MDDLARGWAIVAGQGHGGMAVAVVLLVSCAVAVAVGMWLAMRGVRRRDREESDLRPLQRTLKRSFDKSLPRSFDGQSRR